MTLISTRYPNLFDSTRSSLICICNNAFSADLSSYSVKIDSSDSYAPITRRSNKEITLTGPDSDEYKLAFQLSHELCHASISSDVPNNLRWFEESFAVLSSCWFPRKLRHINRCRYAEYFCKSFRCEKEHFQMSSSPLAGDDLKELESGSGTRNFNDYGNYYKIAKILFPIVKKFPNAWKLVPYLCEIPSDLPFAESLDKLKELVPSDIGDIVVVIKRSLLPG